MSRQQIPLTALRAFEAAARHLSFTKAAEELGVTPAAISNHIKALEEQYGVQLFHRLTRAVPLTDAGHSAMPLLRQGFDQLSEAADRIETLNSGGTITVSVLPFFASKWLVPRLHRFYQMHADIDVRIDASMRAVDLVRDSVDVCVRLGLRRSDRGSTMVTEVMVCMIIHCRTSGAAIAVSCRFAALLLPPSEAT